MHLNQGAILGCLLHHAKDLTIVGINPPWVGHKHLKTGDSFSNKQVHLLWRLLINVGHHDVESVVHRTFASSVLSVAFVAVW